MISIYHQSSLFLCVTFRAPHHHFLASESVCYPAKKKRRMAHYRLTSTTRPCGSIISCWDGCQLKSGLRKVKIGFRFRAVLSPPDWDERRSWGGRDYSCNSLFKQTPSWLSHLGPENLQRRAAKSHQDNPRGCWTQRIYCQVHRQKAATWTSDKTMALWGHQVPAVRLASISFQCVLDVWEASRHRGGISCLRAVSAAAGMHHNMSGGSEPSLKYWQC